VALLNAMIVGPAVRLLDVDQAVSAAGGDGGGLRGAPVVDVADLVDAADGAVGRAGLLGEELALDDGLGVLGDGDAGVAALLRAVADDAVLVHIEVA